MRLAQWVASWLLSSEWRESVMGDIEEERRRRLRAGRRAGSAWAAFAVLQTGMSLRREHHGRGARRASQRLWSGLWMDLRQAWRSLVASPGFTAVAVTVLTLGIGATTAIFSVVDASLLRPVPFDRGDRIMVVGENDKTVRRWSLPSEAPVPGSVGPTINQNFSEWARQQTVFSAFGATRNATGFTVRSGGQPETLPALWATAGLFDVLRVRPQVGQFFTSHHQVPGRDRVLVISDRLWRTRFGADPDIVGKTITFDSGVWEILGVLPSGFRYPVQQLRPTDLIAPYVPTVRDTERDLTKVGRTYGLRAIGRLRDDVTFEEATTQLQTITDGLAEQYPAWFADRVFAATTLHMSVVGRTRSWMLLMLGAVVFVLLIACANVANLMLARAATRSREHIVRAALGASRWRIIRGLMVESLMLSAAGLVGAVMLAWWGVRVLDSAMPTSIPRLGPLGLDVRVLTAAACAAVTTGLIAGLAPAWQWSRADAQQGLRDGGRSATGGRARQRLRAGLVVAEVSLAVVLLVGAGLFLASFWRVVNIDLGIDHRSVVTGGINPRIVTLDAAGLGQARDATGPLVVQVLERLRATPGVVAAAAISGGSPMSGGWKSNSITVPGKPEFQDDADQVQIREVTPEYRDVLQVPLLRGRYVDASDTASSPKVVVINGEAARRFLGGIDPIGVTVKLDDADRVIVGVVGNVRVRGPEVDIAPEAYFPMAQQPGTGATAIMRVSGEAQDFVPVMRAAVLEALPDVPPVVTTLEGALRTLTAQRRFNMMLVGLFGVLAVVIATVGIYGVMAYTVTQQTREIGVRMALGARPQRVVTMVLRRATTYMVVGIAIGLGGAYLLAGFVEGFLFGVQPHDPAVFVIVGAVLVLTGLAAAIIPARRAARVDPIVALRAE